MADGILISVKNSLLFATTAIIGVFTSAQGAFLALFFGFIFNFFIGMQADHSENKKEFSIKKAAEGVKLFMFYVITVFFLYAVLYKNPELANDFANWLTYIVCYFYMTNILRNMKKCFPNSNAISFLYNVLSTEVFDSMKKMLGQKIGIDISDDDNNKYDKDEQK